VHRDYAGLPPVECDPGQINQAFMNLLANACDAAPPGGNVWITTRAEPGAVVISIRDDGPGIVADIRGRIFDPFFTTKDVGEGTGLGLAITQSIVTAHGGQLDVTCPDAGGAIFTVTLPTSAVSAAARSVG
jgi:signal transduction histidine kinase